MRDQGDVGREAEGRSRVNNEQILVYIAFSLRTFYMHIVHMNGAYNRGGGCMHPL